MNRRTLILGTLILTLAAAFLPAQEAGPLRDEKDCANLCDRVMKEVIGGDYRRAFEMLSSVAVPQIRGQVYDLRTTTEDQIGAVKSQYGEVLGFTRVSQESIAGVLFKVVYIQTFENHGLRWEFIFYRGGEHWKLDNVEWDDQLSAVFGG